MKKDKPSLAEMEELLRSLVQQDSAAMDGDTEGRMLQAIRKGYRQECRRSACAWLARGTAALAILATGATLLLRVPQEGEPAMASAGTPPPAGEVPPRLTIQMLGDESPQGFLADVQVGCMPGPEATRIMAGCENSYGIKARPIAL